MRINIFGKGMDRMPDIAFRIMALIFKIRDMIMPIDNILDEFNIRKGQRIVDYGCGPGSYLKKASMLVGATGKVFAVDIHELAMEAVKKRIMKEKLSNVIPLLVSNGRCPLDDNSIDLIYALDMFHMVANPNPFFAELNRISKPDGILFIDNGHQSRDEARIKIIASGAWQIIEENRRSMKCHPLK